MRAGQAVELGIRPGHTNPTEGVGVPLQVRAVEQLGTETFAYGSVAGSDDFAVQLPGQVAIKAKTTLQVAIDASSAHLFDVATGLSCAKPKLQKTSLDSAHGTFQKTQIGTFQI